MKRLRFRNRNLPHIYKWYGMWVVEWHPQSWPPTEKEERQYELAKLHMHKLHTSGI